MDARSQYYDGWEKVAQEAVAAVEASEATEKAEAARALGSEKHPRSEAEAKDSEARAAMKEAKKRWTERERIEQMAKLVVADKKHETLRLSASDFGEKRVACVARCEACVVSLPPELVGVIKLFVEDCEGLEVVLECRLVTSFVDISRSKAVTLRVGALLHTVQVDLSRDVTLEWASRELWDAGAPEGPKIYHAGVTNLRIEGAYAAKVPEDPSSGAEQQFVTCLVDGKLATERIVTRDNSLVGATEREMDAKAVEEAAFKRAEQQKTRGNECFQNAEYGQAAVHYTLALETLKGQPRAVTLANRAACFLKLGEPQKALDDAGESACLDPYYVKAHFRKGLALHALHRYKEALPDLGKARDLEPTNKQILDAIRFAEMRLARGPAS